MRRLLNNHFIRSGFLYSVINFGASLLAYVLNLVIARSFSLTDYGEYMGALAYTVLLGIPLGAFGMMVIKKVGSVDKHDRVRMAQAIEAWLIRELLVLWPLIAGAFLILGAGMYFVGQMSLVAVIFVMVGAIEGIYLNFYGSVLQSYKSFLVVGIFSVITILIKMILAVVVIYFQPNLVWLLSSFLLSGLMALVVGHWLIGLPLAGEKPIKTGVSPVLVFDQVFAYLTRPALIVPLLTTIGIVGLSNVDIILVKKFFSGEMVGLYGSLSLLGKIILYIAAPLSAVAFTYFTGKDSQHQSRKVLLLVTAIIVAIGSSASIFYRLFPQIVVQIIFGEKFLGISDLVWLAAIFGALYSLMNLYAQYFVAKNSKFAYLGILAVVFQAGGIYIFHNNLFQVLLINSLVNGGLVAIYILEVVRREWWYANN